eukprot:1766618-Rhodomonas_salina.1
MEACVLRPHFEILQIGFCVGKKPACSHFPAQNHQFVKLVPGYWWRTSLGRKTQALLGSYGSQVSWIHRLSVPKI